MSVVDEPERRERKRKLSSLSVRINNTDPEEH
jgi:hypothetical protein